MDTKHHYLEPSLYKLLFESPPGESASPKTTAVIQSPPPLPKAALNKVPTLPAILKEPSLVLPKEPLPPSRSARVKAGPDRHMPDVLVPNDTAPKVAAPNDTTPKVAAPNDTTPKVAAPKVVAPKVAAPKVAAPKVDIQKKRELDPIITDVPSESRPLTRHRTMVMNSLRDSSDASAISLVSQSKTSSRNSEVQSMSKINTQKDSPQENKSTTDVIMSSSTTKSNEPTTAATASSLDPIVNRPTVVDVSMDLREARVCRYLDSQPDELSAMLNSDNGLNDLLAAMSAREDEYPQGDAAMKSNTKESSLENGFGESIRLLYHTGCNQSIYNRCLHWYNTEQYKKNPDMIPRMLKVLKQLNDPISNELLGVIYLEGTMCPKNVPVALSYFSKSGIPRANYMAGRYLFYTPPANISSPKCKRLGLGLILRSNLYDNQFIVENIDTIMQCCQQDLMDNTTLSGILAIPNHRDINEFDTHTKNILKLCFTIMDKIPGK